jgi:pilus assembly protein FimV
MNKFLITLIALFFAPLVIALDLGELSVRSLPGEDLQGIITIEDPPANLEELKVSLATHKEFSDAVIAYTPEHEELKFTLSRNTADKVHIRITSEKPLEEEVLHFLLVLHTSDSRLIREYVIIQEGQIYATNAQPTVVKPITYAEQTHNEKLNLPVAALGEKPKRQKRGKVTAEVRELNQYRVRNGDNLWYIAQKLQRHYQTATFYQILAGLYQVNHQEFINGDINKLLAGSSLRLPPAAVIEQMSPHQAMYFIEEQLIRAEQNPMQPSTHIVSSNEGLRILAPKTPEELSTEQARLGQDLALVNESLAQVQRDNEGLQKRVNALQKQIDTLKEMLALRKKKGDVLTREEESSVPAELATTPGIQLSSTGWTVVNQLWEEINRKQWMYYLVISLGVLAIVLVFMSIYIVYRLSKTDKAVKAVMITTPVVAEKAEPKPRKANKPEGDDNDKIAIKLELAQAYYNLGDSVSAKNILQEIIKEGNPTQRAVAQELLDKLG